MTEIYLHFLFAHYGFYGNAPVFVSLVISPPEYRDMFHIFGLVWMNEETTVADGVWRVGSGAENMHD